MARKVKVKFEIAAPEAQEVFLAGDFNEWDSQSIKLTKKRGKTKGLFAAELELEPGRIEYKYLIDGDWSCDPDRDRVPNEFGTDNSLLNVQILAPRTQPPRAAAAGGK